MTTLVMYCVLVNVAYGSQLTARPACRVRVAEVIEPEGVVNEGIEKLVSPGGAYVNEQSSPSSSIAPTLFVTVSSGQENSSASGGSDTSVMTAVTVR